MNTDFITDFIFVEHNPVPSDVILVPGGSHPQLAERAAVLYNQRLAPYILFSGGTNPNVYPFSSEAEWLKSVAIGLGVPASGLLCENKATHTFENAEFSLNLLNDMRISTNRVILVCKAYHSRRVLLTYQYCFPEKTEFLVATTEDKRGLKKDNWMTKTEYIERVMGEVEKIGRYFKDRLL
ncbi:MAG: YdcF family protein [Clostridiales bacterium]|nr:YdcF family protein [Clostridiales bacterium]